MQAPHPSLEVVLADMFSKSKERSWLAELALVDAIQIKCPLFRLVLALTWKVSDEWKWTLTVEVFVQNQTFYCIWGGVPLTRGMFVVVVVFVFGLILL